MSVTGTTAGTYQVRVADVDAARDDMLRIWSVAFPELSSSRFPWIYQENPAGRASCWLATRDGDTVGVAAMVRRRVHADGRLLTAGIAADYAVLPEHRGFGPALALQRQAVNAARAGLVDFVYGTPNQKALPLIRRVGLRQVGSLHEWSRVLRTRNLLARRLGGLGAILAAPFADLLLRALDAVRLPSAGRGAVASAEPQLDDRFDRLEARARTWVPLLGERSADWLRWRFFPGSGGGHRMFAVQERGSDELLGYVVWQEAQGRCTITDLLVADTDRALDTVLALFGHYCRRAGHATIAISFFGCDALIAGLERNGFVARGEVLPVMAYSADDSPAAAWIPEPENWWFLHADTDV